MSNGSGDWRQIFFMFNTKSNRSTSTDDGQCNVDEISISLLLYSAPVAADATSLGDTS